MAGGGLGMSRLPKWTGRFPEILMALIVGAVLCANGYNPYLSAIACIWFYFALELGHGTAIAMGSWPKVALSGRKQTLSYIVDPICRQFEKPLGGKFYCWLFMGLKGFLIGLPLYPFGLAMAVLFPLSYWIGDGLYAARITDNRVVVSEPLSGACLGVLLCF